MLTGSVLSWGLVVLLGKEVGHWSVYMGVVRVYLSQLRPGGVQFVLELGILAGSLFRAWIHGRFLLAHARVVRLQPVVVSLEAFDVLDG